MSNVEFDTGVKATQPVDSVAATPSGSPHPQHAEAQDIVDDDDSRLAKLSNVNGVGDSVEIWDVRRQYVAKWSVRGSSFEGGITGTQPDFCFCVSCGSTHTRTTTF